MADITIFVAFGAGLISFLAPCVLPLVPGFLAYLGGVALDNNASAVRKRFATFQASLFFVLGFVSVFAILGFILHGVLSGASISLQTTIARIGGAIIIFFGLYLMGLVKLPFLERPHHLAVHKKFSSRSVTSFVFGAAFAAGWTPCAGAALGAILGIAVLVPAKAFILLLAYAVGLGIPFLVIGFFAGEIGKYLNKTFVWVQYVNILFGGVLVLLGALTFTQNLAVCREAMWSFPF